MKTTNICRKATTTLVAERLAAAESEKAAKAEERRAAREAARVARETAIEDENKILAHRAAHPQRGIRGALGVTTMIALRVVAVF